MASIESLLNPLPATEFFRQRYTTASSSPRPKIFPLERMKRPRIPKDAPIFTPGKTRGELRYPPHEDDQDEELVKEHKRFEIHPMGHIAEYPRHIPYSSEKKTFLERTGRESFEVFQYTFKIPNEDKTWTVMWDYNIGLVRTTHLFKCNDYSKTTPAKMLNANPGLRDICHSITGGALAAQGYWMPFEAAKAVSATFCWNIRHALTPLFGKEFPSLCIPPDSPRFGKMVIDPDIVRRSTELANDYRLQELDSRMLALQQNHQQRPLPTSPMTNLSLCKIEGSSGGLSSENKHTAHHNIYSENDQAGYTTYDTDRQGHTVALFGNSFTPVNLMLSPSDTATTSTATEIRRNKKSGRREKKKSSAKRALLPPIKDILKLQGSSANSPIRAIPLKRSLDGTENLEASSRPRRHEGGRKANGLDSQEDAMSSDESDEEDDTDLDMDIDTDDISSSSSDSESDLDIDSDLSMLSSSESECSEIKLQRQRRQSSKTRGRRRSARDINKHTVSKTKTYCEGNHLLSSSPSSPSNSALSSSLKRKHQRRDREAAETLLTLQSRSGSSSGADDRAGSTEGEREAGDGHHGQMEKHQAERACVLEDKTNTVTMKGLQVHTIKRLRRASF